MINKLFSFNNDVQFHYPEPIFQFPQSKIQELKKNKGVSPLIPSPHLQESVDGDQRKN